MTVADHAHAAHAERLAETRRLLDAAAATTEPDERRTALREVAALNADDALAVAVALYHQQQPDMTDDSALMAFALEAYVDAVLALDPDPDIDVLPQVVPTLHDAVIRFNRSLIACHHAPGIGERSGLR